MIGRVFRDSRNIPLKLRSSYVNFSSVLLLMQHVIDVTNQGLQHFQ